MIKKLIVNDINQNKFSSGAALFFMAVSAMLLVLTTLLFSGLAGAIDSLMEKAEVPDYMQMHVRDEGGAEAAAAWEREAAEISRFAESRREVGKWQICGFLNLDNNRIICLIWMEKYRRFCREKFLSLYATAANISCRRGT